MTKELWELKYRPSKLTEYVFQDDKHKETIEKYVQEQSIPHLLLNGHRGTGKTSLAMVLKNELHIDDSDFLSVNASDENNVDTIRNKIKGFISTYAMSDYKIVFLDESDRLSPAAQAILRTMMEEYADNARFILTCNHVNKIIPELRSRCYEIKFKKMDKYDILERLGSVLKQEKIKCDVEILEKYVDLTYPDLRKAIQLMQSNIKAGVLMDPSELDSSTEINLQIVELMEKDQYASIRDIISVSMGDDDWDQLYRFLYETLDGIGKFADSKKWKKGIIIIADHLYRHAFVADPEINAMTMFLKLSDV